VKSREPVSRKGDRCFPAKSYYWFNFSDL